MVKSRLGCFQSTGLPVATARADARCEYMSAIGLVCGLKIFSSLRLLDYFKLWPGCAVRVPSVLRPGMGVARAAARGVARGVARAIIRSGGAAAVMITARLVRGTPSFPDSRRRCGCPSA